MGRMEHRRRLKLIPQKIARKVIFLWRIFRIFFARVGIRASLSAGGYVVLAGSICEGISDPATVRPGASLTPARPEMAAVREVPQMRACSARGSIWREFVIYLTARTRPFILGANFRSAYHLYSAPSLQLSTNNVSGAPSRTETLCP